MIESINTQKAYTSRPFILAFSLRKHLLSIIFVLFTIGLVSFSNSNFVAARTGLKLWANNVVPSLLPFLIATNLLSHTNIINFLSQKSNKFMKPLFNVPGDAVYAFIFGLISGYPVGAKIVADLRNNDVCTKDEAERMLCFTNNSGPLFIIGTVGISLFSNTSIGFLLLITHILSALSIAITLGILSRFKKKESISLTANISFSSATNFQKNKSATFSNLGEILSTAILESSKTLIMIGGFVVLFSVLISILSKSRILLVLSTIFSPLLKLFGISTEFSLPLISGLIELTNGVFAVSKIPSKLLSTNIILSAFLLGFGGISVMLQVLSITSKAGLSIKKYAFWKLVQGILAGFYTYILLRTIPFFYFNL